MATCQQAPNGRGSNGQEEEEDELTNSIRLESQQLLLSLPKDGHSWGFGYLHQYQGFWYTTERLQAMITFQRHFQAFDTDLIIATIPRSGTLWLKSMSFAIVNRRQYTTTSKHHPLLTTSPHQLVPFLELDHQLYGSNNCFPGFTNFQSPRLLATHVPYSSIPESIKTTNCKIVYICRNPKDNFISLWHFINKWVSKEGVDRLNIPLEEALDLFCNGVSPYGPYWDHLLGYWKESLERPEKMLFLKYEDMKKDPRSELKTLAEFLGYPFSVEEENAGVIEEILRLCSFEHLRDLEVNKNGMSVPSFENKIHFRKGEVGDWKNYLTLPMAERLDRLVEDKLHGSGLVFENCLG